MTEITKEFLDRLKELEKELKTWGIHQSLLNSINVFLNTMPIIAKLSHRAIKDRHWNELRGEIKNHFDENSAEFNLEYIFNL
mmetsp:Transcript_26825/g.4845  ORF Transcript_26825/g.4845 Transcript_26825/m.4845 type:complete len:82 (+) Transcript_26825:3565-3810(+)